VKTGATIYLDGILIELVEQWAIKMPADSPLMYLEFVRFLPVKESYTQGKKETYIVYDMEVRNCSLSIWCTTREVVK
jgi:hypothetical protein